MGLQDDVFPWFHLVQWCSESAPPDCVFRWDLARIQAVVANLTVDVETFLEKCPDTLPSVSGFSMDDDTVFWEWADALLEWSATLKKVRYRLVPSRMTEDVFWSRYFAAVRRAAQGVIFQTADVDDEAVDAVPATSAVASDSRADQEAVDADTDIQEGLDPTSSVSDIRQALSDELGMPGDVFQLRRCIAFCGDDPCQPDTACGRCRLCRFCGRCGDCGFCRYEDVHRWIDTVHSMIRALLEDMVDQGKGASKGKGKPPSSEEMERMLAVHLSDLLEQVAPFTGEMEDKVRSEALRLQDSSRDFRFEITGEIICAFAKQIETTEGGSLQTKAGILASWFAGAPAESLAWPELDQGDVEEMENSIREDEAFRVEALRQYA